MPLGDEHAAETGRVEHRGDAHESGTDLDATSLGIDRIGLDARCARTPCRVHDAVEQRPGDPAPAIARRGCGSSRWTTPGGHPAPESFASSRGAASPSEPPLRPNRPALRRDRRGNRGPVVRLASARGGAGFATCRPTSPSCRVHAMPGTSSPARRSRPAPRGRPTTGPRWRGRSGAAASVTGVTLATCNGG